MTRTETTGWAIKWDTTNRLDGRRIYLIGAGRWYLGQPPPDGLSGYGTTVFRTRKAAREFIQKHFSYIRHSPDLRAEPHCWRMPQAVKVTVSVEECAQ